jgi:predicted nuclease with TOPRIM domain
MSMDKQLLETRLADLRVNYEAGQEQLRDLDRRKRDLEGTLLRISGAMQVLQELLDEQDK